MKLIIVDGVDKDRVKVAVDKVLQDIDEQSNSTKFVNLVYGMNPLKGKDLNLILDSQLSFYRKQLQDTLQWHAEDEFDVEVHNTSFFRTAMYDIVQMGMDKSVIHSFVKELSDALLTKFEPDDVMLIDTCIEDSIEKDILNELYRLTPFSKSNF